VRLPPHMRDHFMSDLESFDLGCLAQELNKHTLAINSMVEWI